MPTWSKQQEDVLWEHGNEGPRSCADIIRRRYGVARTPEAVRRHAYRIGAPIVEYEICVGCGGKTRSADDEGLCRACHQRRVADEYKARSSAIRRELEEEAVEAERARREYDRERKRASRERGKSRG